MTTARMTALAALAVAALLLMAALPASHAVTGAAPGAPESDESSRREPPGGEKGGEEPAGDPNGGDQGPPEPVDPHRRGSTIYIAARDSSKVIALSRDTGETIAEVKTGRRPSGLAARRDGDRIYVACAGSHTLEVIDGARREVLDRVDFQHGTRPVHVVLGPRERTLYVAAAGLDQVLSIDAGSLQQNAEISVGREPTRLAISPDGRTLYVLSIRSGRVDLVDLRALPEPEVFGSVAVGPEPRDLAVDPATGNVYVVRPDAPVLTVLAPGASQARTVSIDVPAESLAVDSAARRVLLAAPAAAQIAVVSPETGASTKVIDAPEVSRLTVDPDGSHVYALSARRDMMLVVDQMLGSVKAEIPAGRRPWDLVLIP